MNRLITTSALMAASITPAFAQTALTGSPTDMRGAACTPGPATGPIPLAIYMQSLAPAFGYRAELRFCDPKSKLWFPLSIDTGQVQGESLRLITVAGKVQASLALTPVSVSIVTRNGLILKAGLDYSVAGNVVTFLKPMNIAQDIVLAWYQTN